MHKDKIALVTGAASAGGLGFAMARRLARGGAQVWLTDIDGAGAAARAAELRAEGLRAEGLAHDVTDKASWQAVTGAIAAAAGRLDILVNNAGIAVLHALEALEEPDWDRQIAVNLSSVYLGCRAALGLLRAAPGGASVVNISSVAGLVGIAGASAYAASKGGVRLMSKSLALEWAREGIRVNSVHPGVIWTDMQQVAIRDNPAQYDAINAAIPMGRMGAPDDIAEMVAFLASAAAGYITGGEFVVDGGLTAQ